MVEKITALIFATLAFVLELLISIKAPSIESIVAAAFAVVIIVCVAVSLRRRVVITEDAPKGKRPLDAVLKLSDGIAPYVKNKGGKVRITIEK